MYNYCPIVKFIHPARRHGVPGRQKAMITQPAFHGFAAVAAILVQLLMTVLDINLVNVALPVLAKKFSVSDSAIIWIVTIYQLFITSFLFPGAAAGDIYSHKKTFLCGVALFTAASLMCAASANFTMLLAARALQGFGAALVMAVNMALMRMIYPPHILGRGLALNAATVALAAAAGPTVAGIIMSFADWQWLFLINLPLGLISLLLAWKLLPENSPAQHKMNFDWPAAIANAASFGLIFYALGAFAKNGGIWLSACLFACGLTFGIFHVRSERRKIQPMFPVDLFHHAPFTLSIFASSSSFIAQSAAMISMPFLFYNVYGYSELNTGLLMTPWPLATIIIAPLTARYVEKHRHGPVAAFGITLHMTGVLLLLLQCESPEKWQIAWKMALCGAGFGMFQTANNIIMTLATPMRRVGAGGAMKSAARVCGQTLGAALATIAFSIMATPFSAARICLACAIVCAAVAAIFSLKQKIQAPPGMQ